MSGQFCQNFRGKRIYTKYLVLKYISPWEGGNNHILDI